MARHPKIAICIATRERPQGLARLLHSIARMELECCEIEVCVADNDSGHSAKPVCDEFAKEYGIPLRYAGELQTGISFARNKSLELVSPQAEFVAFIDDDEAPSCDWVEELLQAQREHDADVVFGPVIPVFPVQDAPPWVMKAGFFDSVDHSSGDPLRFGATNNALVRRTVIEHFHPVFDPRYALSGASDHHFFMRVRKADFKMVWCDTAVVREWIPQSRMTLRWLLRRAFRTSSHHVLCEKELYPGVGVFARRTFTGLSRIAFGSVVLPITLLLPFEARARALQQVVRGLGLLCGLCGYSGHREYATVHSG